MHAHMQRHKQTKTLFVGLQVVYNTERDASAAADQCIDKDGEPISCCTWQVGGATLFVCLQHCSCACNKVFPCNVVEPRNVAYVLATLFVC